jgi:DNA-binding transcriptional ArsR family regulator
MPARTDRRHATTPAAPPAQRPMVRDVAGRAGRVELTFEARTAYDFVISLYICAGDESDLLPGDRAWLERTRAALPEVERSRLSDCFGEGSSAVFRNLPSIVLNSPELRTAADLVAAVEKHSDDDLARLFVSDMLGARAGNGLVERVLAGDEAARDEARSLVDEYHWAALADLLADPAARVREMRRVLDAWLPRYQEVEPRIAEMVERDVAGRHAAGEDDVVATIEKATGGLRWLPDAGVRRVIMAPIYFGRPYNYPYSGPDWRLFLYPLPEEALGTTDDSAPAAAMVRLYRALGDATRMRVLRLLAERDCYLTELAQHLELSKPTMKHHLALLRAAGLVTVTDEGSMTYYSLRRERIREAGLELERFIG